MKKIYIGSDHAGFKLKKFMIKYLKKKGLNFKDVGSFRFKKDDDYPDYAYKVAKNVVKGKTIGILFCGSSHGMGIAANKVHGIRAVAVNNVKDARKTREHNDANVLCLSGWDLKNNEAKKILDTWLKTDFSNAPRHKRRIKKIKNIEKRCRI